MARFDDAIAFVLGNEGGFSDNPKDSGNYDDAGNLIGTMYGISGKVARAWGYMGPMEELPLSTAKAIYKAQYWAPSMDAIESTATAMKILDFRVNFGQGGGTILAQQAANQFEGVNIAEDGGLGPATVAAINSIDPAAYMDALVEIGADKYNAIAEADPEKAGFLPGWLKRVVQVPLDNPGTSAGVLLLLIGGAALMLRGK
jgi:lysozyme family protein